MARYSGPRAFPSSGSQYTCARRRRGLTSAVNNQRQLDGHDHRIWLDSDPRVSWMDAPSGPVDYDAELRLHTEVLRRAYGIGPHDHVLDIGCGGRGDHA